tara:strand:- start:317 stop:529 length:213 start_codon:yes stop_codon:yes gene_type:complete
MLTVELKNNGRLLAHLTASPKGTLVNGEKEYHYEYYKVGEKIRTGVVFQSKGDKYEKLLADIIFEREEEP